MSTSNADSVDSLTDPYAGNVPPSSKDTKAAEGEHQHTTPAGGNDRHLHLPTTPSQSDATAASSLPRSSPQTQQSLPLTSKAEGDWQYIRRSAGDDEGNMVTTTSNEGSGVRTERFPMTVPGLLASLDMSDIPVVDQSRIPSSEMPALSPDNTAVTFTVAPEALVVGRNNNRPSNNQSGRPLPAGGPSIDELRSMIENTIRLHGAGGLSGQEIEESGKMAACVYKFCELLYRLGNARWQDRYPRLNYDGSVETLGTPITAPSQSLAERLAGIGADFDDDDWMFIAAEFERRKSPSPPSRPRDL